MGPIAGLEGGKSLPHRDSIPDRPARSSVAIPTEIPGPLFDIYCLQIPPPPRFFPTLSLMSFSRCIKYSVIIFAGFFARGSRLR